MGNLPGQSDCRSRDRLATRLAQEFNVTPKAVRDIWTLRMWFKTTEQLWSAEDTARFLSKTLYTGCRHRGLNSMRHVGTACRGYCRAGRTTATVDGGRHDAQRLAQGVLAATGAGSSTTATIDQPGQRPPVPAPSSGSSIKDDARFEDALLVDPAPSACGLAETLLLEWHATLRALSHEDERM